MVRLLITNMRGKQLTRKLRKTYMLSSEAVGIIEEEKKERHANSASAALEGLLQEVQRRKKSTQMTASISSYYDSLSEAEMKEDRLWGAFAERQFPLD